MGPSTTARPWRAGYRQIWGWQVSDNKTAVGSVELVSLSDGQGGGDPVAVFPDSSIEQWRSEYPELLDPDGHIHPRYGSVALRSQGRTIIVDTGLGCPDDRLLADMAATRSTAKPSTWWS